MSNFNNNFKFDPKPIAYVVVDKSQGDMHVGEPFGAKQAARDRAWELNTKKDTTRYAVKPLFAQ